MLKYSVACKNGVLNSTGLKTQFNLAKLYIFAGTIPDTPDEALDMVATHTECVPITNNSTGTGLTFDSASGGVLYKAAAETWSGVVATGGFDTSNPITPTFYRLCAAGDNGRGVADGSTGYRIQGTVGGPGSGADLRLGTDNLTNGITQPIGDYSVSVE